MDTSLNVLHLEDDPDFAELVEGMLEDEGIRATSVIVSDLPSFVAALEQEAFDIILADYQLPSCSGAEALAVAQRKSPHIPFLIVSGTVTENAAIDSLNKGATDYVLKTWIERLVPAVRRAVQEARERDKRQEAENALTCRERYFQTLTENSLDVLTILSREGAFRYNSPSLKHVLGFEPADLLGTSVFALIHPDDLAGAIGAFEQALAEPHRRITHQLRCRRRDHSWCYLEVVGQNRLADPQIGGVVLNTRDITERKQAEARLRLQSAALESADNAIVIADRSGGMLWVNPAFTRLTGYSLDEVLGRNPRFLSSGKHNRAFYRELWGTILSGRVWRSEMINRRKDGTLYTEETTITPVRDEQGTITHFVAVKQDITARKLAEQALIESEKRFSTFMAHLPVAASLKDSEGRFIFANRYLEDVFDLSEWKGKTNLDLFPDAAAAQLTAIDGKALVEGPTVVEESLLDAAGRERRFETYRFPINVQDAQKLLGVLAIDVTERRELEGQLRQAQKMDAIGHLAGGVAHDFNNLLTVIRGNAELALMDSSQLSDRVRRCLEQVTAATDRSANLVRQLLTFSRKGVIKSQALNLNEVIANMTKMLVRIIGENYDLECDYGSSLPFIQADAGMLEQVLVNLVVNARDAMPKGGQLVVTTALINIDSAYVNGHPSARVGRFVSLKVTDTGTGILPEHLPHIFEPFFTTKGTGKGTGLGLALVYGIVRQHQGWVEVSSRWGTGTTFSVFLPALADSVTPLNSAAPEPPPKGGSEGVLVVEDDASVRTMTRQILETAGYRVWEAGCAEEARKTVREYDGAVHLMLTDIVLPGGMSGLELADKICEERPHLRVLVMSGYSAEVMNDTQDDKRWSRRCFLEKPYPPAALLRALRGCLDGRAPSPSEACVRAG